MRKKNKRSISVWLIWSIVFLVFVIFGIFIYSMSKETNKKKEVENEIDSLRQEAEKIEKENMALEERIAYLSSKDYREIQVKDKFNLQNPKENLIIITQGIEKKEESILGETKIVNAKTEETEDVPNFQRWLSYFFKQ